MVAVKATMPRTRWELVDLVSLLRWTRRYAVLAAMVTMLAGLVPPLTTCVHTLAQLAAIRRAMQALGVEDADHQLIHLPMWKAGCKAQ